MASKMKQKGQMVSGSLFRAANGVLRIERRPLVGRGFATSGAMALGLGEARARSPSCSMEKPRRMTIRVILERPRADGSRSLLAKSDLAVLHGKKMQ
jgi:hypothetical protein